MAKNVTTSVNSNVGGISITEDIPSPVYPKYEIAKISGTDIELGKEPTLFPENQSAYDNFLPNKNAPTELTPYLEMGNILRIIKQKEDMHKGLRDPRELFNDTPDSPSGIFQVNTNTLNNEHQVSPKNIKEPFLTATVSPYGPIRESESLLSRKDVYSMYNLSEPILSEIGLDSNGVVQFSDGNSFIEKCVFTGYDKSFKPLKSWKPKQQTKVVNDPFVVETDDGKLVGTTPDGELVLSSDDKKFRFRLDSAPEVNHNHVFISKSGYYFTKRPPLKSLFLGYNDSDMVPNSATFWEKSRVGKFNFYNDRICENELIHPSNILSNQYTKFANGGFKEYPLRDKEQILYGNTQQGSASIQGSYGVLLNSLSKVDIVDIKKIRPGVTGPVLRRRIEQYGPNPLQHLYYMDCFDWRKYTTTYIPNDELTLDIFAFTKPIQSLIGKNPINDNRILLFNNAFGNRRGRFDFVISDETIFFTDTTPILDIYFGLMEMHLKSFSWKDIMSIVDTIPDFRSSWNDPNWEKLSYDEKNLIRFSEIDQQLESVWQLISQVLDSLDTD